MMRGHRMSINNTAKQAAVNIDTLLVLEKTFERSGHQWVENLNIIEQLLVGIIENIGTNLPDLKTNFVIRRLPTYTASFVNTNEYTVIVEDFDFTLTPPHSEDRDSLQGNLGKAAAGQVEIFPLHVTESTNNHDMENIGPTRAINSHDFFNKFATAFHRIFTQEIDQEKDDGSESSSSSPKEKVQLLGPHLLQDIKCNPDVQKIFTLTQPSIPLSKLKRSNCRLTLDPSKSVLIIELDHTAVIVRPCLFYSKGCGRLNNSLLERIPLFHPAILSIGESLTKGFLLTPSNTEALWTLQFWPSESHVISNFHPSSIIGRIFKLYGSFCLFPTSFWDCLNESFIVGVEGITKSSDKLENNFFSVDFFISSFLFELERFPKIEDWGPSNFTTRFMNLLKSAADSYEKGFYPHYFTKTNLLRGLWRNANEFSSREKHTTELKNIAELESSSNVFDYGEYEQERYKEHYPSDLDELDDEFGFHDHLSVQDEKDISTRQSELAFNDRSPGRMVNPFSGMDSCRSSIGEKGAGAVGGTANRKSKSLSKRLGANILRRFSTLNKGRSENSTMRGGDRPKSMTDIASGFEEMVNQMRREETIGRHLPPTNSSKNPFNDVAETSFLQKKRSTSMSSSVQLVGSSRHSVAFDNEGFQQSKDSIYSIIIQFINEISISEHFTDTDMILHLEKCKKVLYSQGELIGLWCQIMTEVPKPKYICPHTFSPRQIQYISLVVQTLTKCSPNNISAEGDTNKMAKMLSWEISGDILRTVLYQLRSDVSFCDSLKVKEKLRHGEGPRKFSFKTSKSFSEGSNRNKAGRFSKFSLRKGGNDICKSHAIPETETDSEKNTQFALEDPETAATHRLLQWLWQLRNSEIGRLSLKAEKYIEALHLASHVNSHFLDQFSEQKLLRSTAIRSAVAVSRIMADEKFQPHIPLLAASKKGWLWAEMVLSLVSWNQEKDIIMNAEVPIINAEGIQEQFKSRQIQMTNMMVGDTSKLNKMKKSEPDTDAATLAFHSELATPLGWNDFEDPRRPGPQTASILIFSSLGYFNQWEMVAGNIVQTMVRLQKFNNLQHIGSLLYPPHRKAALNEVRKLNKSVSFRTFQFDDNVMTKTFRRLASLRNTRRIFSSSGIYPPEERRPIFYTCQQIGCMSTIGETKLTVLNGQEVECTRF